MGRLGTVAMLDLVVGRSRCPFVRARCVVLFELGGLVEFDVRRAKWPAFSDGVHSLTGICTAGTFCARRDPQENIVPLKYGRSAAQLAATAQAAVRPTSHAVFPTQHDPERIVRRASDRGGLPNRPIGS